MSLQGKVAFITGASRGIGLAVAKLFLKNEAKGVAIIDILESAAEKALEEIKSLYGDDKAIFIKTDVTVKKDLEDAFEKTAACFNQLDIVVNNAGIVNELNWEKMLNINLNAVINGNYLAMKKYLPKYKCGEEGVIVNTSSTSGLQQFEYVPIYSLCKAGVVSLGQSLGDEKFYQKHKVRVLTVCPGWAANELHSAPPEVMSAFPELMEKVVKKLSGKNQTVECVAEAFVRAIEKGRNGSVWVVENGEPAYEIIIPKKADMKKCMHE